MTDNVIIFDWDDTVFPNAFYHYRGYDLDQDFAPEEIFSTLDKCVKSLLEQALSLAEVCIVTASTPTWVWETSRRFYPETHQIIHKFLIYSVHNIAKTFTERHLWKVGAFFQFQNREHILSIGDDIAERTALLSLPVKLKKHIGMIENPSGELLLYELNLLRDCLKDVFMFSQNLDVKLSVIPERETVIPEPSDLEVVKELTVPDLQK